MLAQCSMMARIFCDFRVPGALYFSWRFSAVGRISAIESWSLRNN
jgi:hypothetical protein